MYRDLGAGRRWVQPVAVLASVPVLVAVCLFASRSPWLWPLYGTVALTVLSLGLWLATGVGRPRVDLRSHERLVRRWNPATVPSIDVYLPVCGEPVDVLANTFGHVARLAWAGRVETWVLDDGADPAVEALAAQFGFRYRVREDRGHLKKAGNLRSAYRATSGDHIVIFDADFCPRPDFLAHLVPYLDDPSVGIVQSPQDFDTDESMGWLQRTAGATQEIFYRWVQPARDRIGATVCCGTNAIYRRAALEAIGGFPEIDHSEDLYTGMWMLKAGYLTRFVPVRLATGLCPDELGPFLTQQYRWANGSTALITESRAELSGLSRRQRLAIWAGFVYYGETALFAINIFVPAVVMCFWYPQDVDPVNLVVFLPSLWILTVLYPVAHRSRWRLEVLRVQVAQSFSHLVVFAHALRGHSAGWVPTGGKGGSSALAREISTVMVLVLGLGSLAWVAGVTLGTARYGLQQFWAMLALAAVYVWIAAPLVLEGLRIIAPGWFRRPAGTALRGVRTVVRALTTVPAVTDDAANTRPAHGASA